MISKFSSLLWLLFYRIKDERMGKKEERKGDGKEWEVKKKKKRMELRE